MQKIKTASPCQPKAGNICPFFEHMYPVFDIGEHYFKEKAYNQACYAYTKYLEYCPGGENANKANLETLIRIQPHIVSRLTTMLSERIWTMHRQLAQTLITEPLGRMYDTLLLHLEKNRVDTERESDYKFDFSGEDLVKMTGLSKTEGAGFVRELLSDAKKMQQLDGKLYC